MNISADEVITLNATGGHIWARLQKGDTVEQIVADLVRDTGQDASVIASDVNDFVEQLAHKRLVTL